LACDVSEGRLFRSADRLKRAGVHNVQSRVVALEGDKWLKRSKGSFDRVLVDAPCTGTGTWRRNPDARWKLRPEDLAELTVKQGAILDRAAKLVRPGGRLVYVTCSLLPDENERQIEGFLAQHADFALKAPEPPLPAEGPYLRLSPARHGTDGFFAALLERTAA
jgi:16S rRNA (cytosine967-C5)-methyltransferase